MSRHAATTVTTVIGPTLYRCRNNQPVHGAGRRPAILLPPNDGCRGHPASVIGGNATNQWYDPGGVAQYRNTPPPGPLTIRPDYPPCEHWGLPRLQASGLPHGLYPTDIQSVVIRLSMGCNRRNVVVCSVAACRDTAELQANQHFTSPKGCNPLNPGCLHRGCQQHRQRPRRGRTPHRPCLKIC